MHKHFIFALLATLCTSTLAQELPNASTTDASLYVEGKQCRLVTVESEVQGPCAVFVEGGMLTINDERSTHAAPVYSFTNKAMDLTTDMGQAFAELLREAYRKPPVEEQPTDKLREATPWSE